MPIIFYALFDERYQSSKYFEFYPKSKNALETMPAKYLDNLKNPIYTNKMFFLWYLKGLIDGAICLVLGFFALPSFDYDGMEPTLDI